MPGTWGRATTKRRDTSSPHDRRVHFCLILSLRLGFPLLATSAPAFAPAGDRRGHAPSPAALPAARPPGSLFFFLLSGLGIGCLVSNLTLGIGEMLSLCHGIV